MFVPSALVIAAALWIAYFVALAVEKRILDRAIRRWKSLSKLGKCAVALVLVGFIAYAGTKPSSGDGGGADGGDDPAITNVVEGAEGDATWASGEDTPRIAPPSELASLGGYASPLALANTPDSRIGYADCAAGFVLQGMGTNETFDFTPPEGAVVATNWLLHGASTQPLRLSFDDWVFPFGEEGYSNFTVFACGEVMPGEVNTDEFLKPFAAPLGILPQVRWGLLPSDEASLFWYCFTPSNALLLTWQNALLGRETTNPVSFQAELKPSGGFVFRYDLSRLATGDSLTNVVIGAKNGEAVSSPLLEDGTVDFRTSGGDTASPLSVTNLTSLVFASSDERRCDAFRADFEDALGGLDPLACPEGSTNTVLEHVFYSGTTTGAFAYPQSTDGNAVLMVSVSGSGSGELMVGSSFVPLVGRPAPARGPRFLAAPPPSSSALAVSVPRGSTQKVFLRGDSTLSVSFSSDDFAFGALPDLSGRHFTGWINFPFVNATVPCIHDYTARKKLVSLPLGAGAGELSCEWQGTSQIEVENIPPRSAMLTGHFSGRTTTPVTYALSHPNYLFGQTAYSQTARYCPQPPEEDDDDDTSSGDPDWYDGEADDDDEEHYCWCCFWGSCYEGCGCGCACYVTGGEDDPADPVDPEPEDYDDASTNYPHMSGVLKIREPFEYAAPIRLTVPLEHRNCCPCPDHASNWVAVVYQSDSLKVVDAATGMDFRRSGESLDVKIAGVSPSFAVGDAGVSFAANGEVTHECKFTVLGVGINGGYVPNVGDADLKMLNEYNSQFGLPIPINTNLWDAVELKLQTNVRLPSGNIHLGFEDSTAPFEVWIYDGWAGEFRRLTSSSGGPLDMSFAGWRQLVGGSSDSYSPTTWIYITAADAGKATLVYRYWGVLDGMIVEDEARQVITAIAPTIRGDVNHDGEIGDADAALQVDGVPFRFWYNDESVKGEYVGQDANTARNGNDNVVNGKYDLVNLFPLEMDVSEFIRAWGSAAQFRLHAGCRGLKFCVLNDHSPDNIAAMQTTAVHTDQNEALEEAALHTLDYGGTNLTSVLSSGGIGKMLAFEASGEIDEWSGPRLVVSLGDRDVFTYRIPLSISSVDDMYRYLDLRGAESDPQFTPVLPDEPGNLPDSETDSKHFVFVHGYNVNAAQSRAWARTMFKRLWWAGSRSKFTAVDWFGDYSQIADRVSPNYYQNVVHAFRTAPALKAACDALPGVKVMLAHSLGNMLTCEAIARHGLQYSKYYMLNAAVPAEAFDAGALAQDNMKPLAWQRYSDALFACNWHRSFSRTDGRSGLTWRGIFAGVHDAVNCYSPTEDVLGNAPAVGAGGAWSAQELLKGTGTMYLLPRVRREGGWGFNPDHTVPLSQDGELLKTEYTDEEMVTSPPFLPFAEDWLHSTNAVTAAQVAEVRDRILADGIPALTFAAGANPVDGVSGNYNYQGADNTPNGWPRKNGDVAVWEHSDIRNVAYYYVHVLFEKIKNLR